MTRTAKVARFQGRLSSPFLDRLDLRIEVPVNAPAELAAAPAGEGSAQVAERVATARERALRRQGCSNARLPAPALDDFARPEATALLLLHKAAARLAWSGRSYHRVLRVARSVADLAGSDEIGPAQMAEAVQLCRGLHNPS